MNLKKNVNKREFSLVFKSSSGEEHGSFLFSVGYLAFALPLLTSLSVMTPQCHHKTFCATEKKNRRLRGAVEIFGGVPSQPLQCFVLHLPLPSSPPSPPPLGRFPYASDPPPPLLPLQKPNKQNPTKRGKWTRRQPEEVCILRALGVILPK